MERTTIELTKERWFELNFLKHLWGLRSYDSVINVLMTPYKHLFLSGYASNFVEVSNAR